MIEIILFGLFTLLLLVFSNFNREVEISKNDFESVHVEVNFEETEFYSTSVDNPRISIHVGLTIPDTIENIEHVEEMQINLKLSNNEIVYGRKIPLVLNERIDQRFTYLDFLNNDLRNSSLVITYRTSTEFREWGSVPLDVQVQKLTPSRTVTVTPPMNGLSRTWKFFTLPTEYTFEYFIDCNALLDFKPELNGKRIQAFNGKLFFNDAVRALSAEVPPEIGWLATTTLNTPPEEVLFLASSVTPDSVIARDKTIPILRVTKVYSSDVQNQLFQAVTELRITTMVCNEFHYNKNDLTAFPKTCVDRKLIIV